MVPPESNVDQLVQAILAQAEAEGKRTREAALATAQRILSEAEDAAANRQKGALALEAARTARVNAAALAATRLRVRRTILEAREELIGRVFAKAEERRASIQKDISYARLLVKLVQEAVSALDGDEFIVGVAPQDYELAEQALKANPMGERKRIEARPDEQVRDLGCIVWQSDRRAFYDNTASAIIARHHLRLRALVAEALWGKDSRWDEV